MRLACPACAAEYDVPDAVLKAAPRPMRCARCQHVWTPEPALAAAVENIVREPDQRSQRTPFPIEIEAPSRALVTAEHVAAGNRLLVPQPPRRRALGAAWLLTAAVLLAGMVGAVAQREAVMAAWPPSARAYAALGLR